MYFFSATEQFSLTLSHDSMPFKSPGSARVTSSVKTSWMIPGAETRILFSSFLQPLRILITTVSFWVLTYPLVLRVGFLRVWIVALLVPSWCPSHLAFDCETKVISALTKVPFRPECLHILPVDCPPSPGIREDCHCPHFPDEESRLSESVSLVAEPQRQKE